MSFSRKGRLNASAAALPEIREIIRYGPDLRMIRPTRKAASGLRDFWRGDEPEILPYQTARGGVTVAVRLSIAASAPGPGRKLMDLRRAHTANTPSRPPLTRRPGGEAPVQYGSSQACRQAFRWR